jgi:multiple sugar transport system ATP-binding protein
MAFENYALYSHLSVFENLAFPLRAKRLPEAEIRRLVLEMGELLHIGELLDRKPGFLSGGQRQRVALGRCLIRQADIYLLDEPISHLDARLRIQMRAELKNICLRRESTVIHVTHDYREAMALADRVIVLNKGRVMQDASPTTVYHNPTNEFVARFVGDPPMSFVAANFFRTDGRSGLRLAGMESAVALPGDFDAEAVVSASSDVKIGFRAAEVEIAPAGATGDGTSVAVHLLESQGHRNLVTVKLGNDLVQVAAPPDRDWNVGEVVKLRIPGEAIHVFADGQAVYHPAARDERVRAQ